MHRTLTDPFPGRFAALGVIVHACLIDVIVDQTRNRHLVWRVVGFFRNRKLADTSDHQFLLPIASYEQDLLRDQATFLRYV